MGERSEEEVKWSDHIGNSEWIKQEQSCLRNKTETVRVDGVDAVNRWIQNYLRLKTRKLIYLCSEFRDFPNDFFYKHGNFSRCHGLHVSFSTLIWLKIHYSWMKSNRKESREMCSMKCCRLYDKAKIARKTILVSRVCNVKLCKWSCANAACRDAPYFACWQQA